MKKLLFFSLLLVNTISFSQNWETRKDVAEASVYFNESVYPRLILTSYSDSKSGFGVWGSFEYSRLRLKAQWINEKGYLQKQVFSPSENIALTYRLKNDKKELKLLLGAGGNLEKMFFGPLLGLFMETNFLKIEAIGVYSLVCAYKESYPNHLLKSDFLSPKAVYLKNFDPNSWYRFSVTYHYSKLVSVGIVSERFFTTGPFIELNPSLKNNTHIDDLKFKFIYGTSFDFGGVGLGISLIMEI